MSPTVSAELTIPLAGAVTLIACLLAGHVCLAWRGGLRGFLLVGWMGLSALWALVQVARLAGGPGWLPAASALLEVARQGAALGVLLSLTRAPRPLVAGGGALLLLALLWGLAVAGEGRSLSYLQLALSVLALCLLEIYWRSLSETARWAAKPLCLALLASAAFDVYAQSEAALFGRSTAATWAARLMLIALTLPLVWLYAARTPPARVAVSLSRGAVFHSTALAACGGYLLLMSAAGFYVRDFGGRWGPLLQGALVSLLALLALVLAASASVRARGRLFLARHFFKLRYDYRKSWLGLTRALAASHSFADSGERVVACLAELVESPGGVLWWARDEGDFYPCAAVGLSLPQAIEPAVSAGLAGLRDVEGVARVEDSRALAVIEAVPRAGLIVPLARGGVVKGFVVLQSPRVPLVVDWEVRDALATVAAQALTDLNHWQALEALLAARKFEAASRLAAYTVHDLKNCVLELGLTLDNARRHGHKPQFQSDLLRTLEHLLGRMRALIDTIRRGMQSEDQATVDLAPLLANLLDQFAPQRPAPVLQQTDALTVRADATRLTRVIGHLIQNAIDATDAAGRVWVNLARHGQHAVIEIHDTGSGMSEDFVRHALFKPFQTTKAQGMGIGAFESLEYIRSLGGRIEVTSAPGEGSAFALWLPLVEAQAAA